MKSRRILAAAMASAVALSATAMISAASEEDTIHITGDLGMEGAAGSTYSAKDDNWTWSLNLLADGVLDENVEIDDIYGVSIVFAEDTIEASANTGIGGAIAFSAESNGGWDSAEWGNEGADKAITLDAKTRSITRLEEAPCLSADDLKAYASVALQVYWGPDVVEIESLSLLGEDGTALKTFPVEEDPDEDPDTDPDKDPDADPDKDPDADPDEDDPAVTPGDSDKAPIIIEAEFKGVGTKGIEGADVNDVVLVKNGVKYTWADVESVTFSSEKLFSVAFSIPEDEDGNIWFIMGKDEVPSLKSAADEDPEWGYEWTLGEAELALFDTTKPDGGNVKLTGKEDGTDISVTVIISADAKGEPVEDDEPTNSDSPETGIALAVAPVILAAAGAAVVIGKKRK